MQTARRVLIVTMVVALAAPALAQEFRYQPLQPVQPLQPLTPTYHYELPSVPDYRIEVPLVPTYSPPQRRVDPRDYMQQFTTPQEIKRQFERMDRASERRRWAECAKYNRHCVNMLRSLGGR